jgi:hypothetical protein
MPWGEIGRGALGGARKATESLFGAAGDAQDAQWQLMQLLADRAPDAVGDAVDWGAEHLKAPLPTSEQVQGATEKILPHNVPEGPLGEGFSAIAEYGFDPTTYLAPAAKLAGLAIPAAKLATKGAKVTRAIEDVLPARDELARVVRPAQEKSGVFDYGVSYPARDLGVERFRPKKVPERTVDLLSRQDVYDKMVEGVDRGTPVKDWYETGPLRKSFEDQLGAEEGLGKFDQFIDAVAATSPRSDVGTNVRNASYYYTQAQPFPGRNSVPSIEDLPEKNPAPYGHLAQKLHRMNAEKTVFPGGEGLDFKQNAKPIAFAANLKGDPSVATIDTHAFRAPAMMGEDPRFLARSFLSEKGAVPRNIQDEVAQGQTSMDEARGRGAFWESKPRPTEYAAHEDYYKKIGNELGLTPAETQAAGWVGHGGTTGLASAPKSFMDFVEERILLTAEKLGMDPREIWKRVVSGKMPLLGVGGAAAGASALSDPERKY